MAVSSDKRTAVLRGAKTVRGRNLLRRNGLQKLRFKLSRHDAQVVFGAENCARFANASLASLAGSIPDLIGGIAGAPTVFFGFSADFATPQAPKLSRRGCSAGQVGKRAGNS